MSQKNKVYLTIALFLGVLIVVIGLMTYYGLRDDPERVQQVEEQATNYLDEHFDEDMEIVDVMHDNASIYEQFRYAAIVEPSSQPGFNFLVYEHLGTGEYTDSYVAEVWEDELEDFLMPRLEESFGEDSIKELWMTYPKDIGMQLDLTHESVPSLEDADANVVIRLTLARGQEDGDEAALDDIIEAMKSEMNVNGGHFTLAFSDSALFFKDSNINEDF